MPSNNVADLLLGGHDGCLHFKHAVEIVDEADIDFLTGWAARDARQLELAQKQVVFHTPALALVNLDLNESLVSFERGQALDPPHNPAIGAFASPKRPAFTPMRSMSER